ncbi:hypothetical protein [Nitrospirillum pindoramense]|uniref:ACT domain-containing protein n=1 Tax=Nitrospirillum amazonense TaxID=28077 RepID=A0A560GWX5_9PROT|nr:hypothetical protein [Nitrospirillum amazonense]TWB38527.1 hypothetical protein FBZ90_11215 [Nitrospirillum amazonense]
MTAAPAAAPLNSSPVMLSVAADASPGLLSRLMGTLARLDIVPLHVYARRRADVPGEDMLEVDIQLPDTASAYSDRVAALFRNVVGVHQVAGSV